MSNSSLRSERIKKVLTSSPNFFVSWSNSLLAVLIALAVLASWYIVYPDVKAFEAQVTSVESYIPVASSSEQAVMSLRFSNGAFVSKGDTVCLMKYIFSQEDLLNLKRESDTFYNNMGNPGKSILDLIARLNKEGKRPDESNSGYILETDRTIAYLSSLIKEGIPVLAPESGTLHLPVSTAPNSIVKKGQTLFSVGLDEPSGHFKAVLTDADSLLSPGMLVKLKFPSGPGASPQVVHGEIKEITSITGQGSSYLIKEVSSESAYVDRTESLLGKGQRNATLEVAVGEHRLFHRLFGSLLPQVGHEKE